MKLKIDYQMEQDESVEKICDSIRTVSGVYYRQ